MKLASLLQPELIHCSATCTTYQEIKDALAKTLCDLGNADYDELTNALAEREALSTTIVAPGIAFPHARIKSAKDFYILLATSKDGIKAEGKDEPVKFVAMFVMPDGESNLYLRSVSALSTFLIEPGNLDALTDSSTADQIIELLNSEKINVRDTVTAQDIMRRNAPSLKGDSLLREVADLMVKESLSLVPIVDDENNYVGAVTAECLLKVGLPDYLLTMDNVDFLSSFEPFKDLLVQEKSMTIDQIMNDIPPKFEIDTPMIQVAGKLIKDNISCAVVLDNGKLAGTISSLDFVHKVVRA